jgi:cytochrome c553
MLSTHRAAIALPACLFTFLASGAGTAATMTDQLLASQCAQCHGTYGRAVADIEGLAGKSAGSLYTDLIEMQMEGPAEEIMEHQAMGYTPAQLQRIAQYYASLSESGRSSSSYSSTESSSATTTSSSHSERRRSRYERDDD